MNSASSLGKSAIEYIKKKSLKDITFAENETSSWKFYTRRLKATKGDHHLRNYISAWTLIFIVKGNYAIADNAMTYLAYFQSILEVIQIYPRILRPTDGTPNAKD